MLAYTVYWTDVDLSLHLDAKKGDRITQIEPINYLWSFGYCRGKCGRFLNSCLKIPFDQVESYI